MDLAQLITKLESATAGSPDLDQEIARAIGWEELSDAPGMWCDPKGTAGIWEPLFSRSLDAALGLVPELSELHLDWWHIQAQATIYLAGEVAIDSETRPTPALALCIAALKARQALSSTGDE